MASPAQARMPEPEQKGVFGLTAQQIIVMIIQLLVFAYGYGQLKQSVDSLHERITIIENDLRSRPSTR